MCLSRINSNARVIAHMSMSTGSIIEQRRLATVRITHQRHIDGSALLHGFVLDIVVLVYV